MDNFGSKKLAGRSLPEALRPAARRTVSRLAWKSFPPISYRGFRESHQAEIAAYELDKLLKLDMVPPTVERKLEGHIGAATFWVENAAGLTKGKNDAPDAARWGKQLARVAMFDSLIGNGARNLGNTLRDPVWNLILLDHSRRSGAGDEPLADLSRIDKELWGRIEALTRPQLDAALSPWLEQTRLGRSRSGARE